MKKELLLSLFLLSSLTLASAQQLSLSRLNIYNVDIVAQDERNLTIYFNVQNEVGIQPDIKYGVFLERGGVIIDQEIYDEAFDAREGEIIARALTYIAPTYLEGEYTVFVELQNDRGLLMGQRVAGTINLTAENNSLVIDTASCRVFMGNKTYFMGEGYISSPNEMITAICKIKNPTAKAFFVRPVVETHKRTQFGDIVSTETLTDYVYSINATEGSLEFKVPVQKIPQAYDCRILLQDTKTDEVVSNPIYLHYVVGGKSATIQNLILDKDFYVNGEVANISVFWTLAADDFPNDQALPTKLDEPRLMLQMQGEGHACSDLIHVPISDTNFADLSVPIIQNCTNPSIIVKILEGEEVLDSKKFEIKTILDERAIALQESGSSAPKDGFGPDIIIVASIIASVFFVILLFLLIIKKKR